MSIVNRCAGAGGFIVQHTLGRIHGHENMGAT